MSVPDLSSPLRVHVVAAGGAAMSAVAHILAAMGHTVTGSDQVDSAALDRLRAEGLTMWTGHHGDHVQGVDVVAVSTAVKPGNIELDTALAAGTTVASRPDMMEAIAIGQRTLAISGTHGKTTTSAMAALVAEAVGWNPSFIVGGVVNQLGTGSRWTGSGRLVVEADESDNSFLRFRADDVIVTNIESDHLDFHGSLPALETAFRQFVVQGSGVKVLCVDDAGVQQLLRTLTPNELDLVRTYGTSADANYQMVDLHTAGMRTSFSVEVDGVVVAHASMGVPGDHNARNATAVFAMFHSLGHESELISETLSSFTGVGRRFEYRAELGGVTFVDDYAHLPSEVATVVGAAARGDWKRVIAVFEPHRYTRIRDVGSDFAHSFSGASMVVVTPLFAAGQEAIEGISSLTVSNAVRGAHPELDVRDVGSRSHLVELLGSVLQPGDLCLTMNAGELTTLPTDMLNSSWARRVADVAKEHP